MSKFRFVPPITPDEPDKNGFVFTKEAVDEAVKELVERLNCPITITSSIDGLTEYELDPTWKFDKNVI